MSDEKKETAAYSAPVTIPAGTFKLEMPWEGWGLTDQFHPSVSAGTVNVTRGRLVRIIDEMARVIAQHAPDHYDFTKAKEAVQSYQKDDVFEIGRPPDRKLTGRIENVEDVPKSGGVWITFELHPPERAS